MRRKRKTDPVEDAAKALIVALVRHRGWDGETAVERVGRAIDPAEADALNREVTELRSQLDDLTAKVEARSK